MHVHITNCCFTLAGHSNICGKLNITHHFHNNNNMNRISIIPYSFYGLLIYIDHTSRYSTVPILKQAYHHFLPFHHCHFHGCCAIHDGKRDAIVLLLDPTSYVCWNRWFEEKQVLMHLHFA